MLDQLKDGHGGLRSFFNRHGGVFAMEEHESKPGDDPMNEGVFFITTTSDTKGLMEEVSKNYSDEDEAIFAKYGAGSIDPKRVYTNTVSLSRRDRTGATTLDGEFDAAEAVAPLRVILDLVRKSPEGRVSSRDVGRYLKAVVLPNLDCGVGDSMLDQMKRSQGGLRNFLTRHGDVLTVFSSQSGESADPRVFGNFWCGKKDVSNWVKVHNSCLFALSSVVI